MNIKIFADDIEEAASKQIDRIATFEAFKDAKIRILPDVHAGKGCVCGFTANLGEKVVPNLIGVDNIIRKSAISAKKDERVLIPLNMRDGSIIAVGRGNADWNESAPHGAGRLMSRKETRQRISIRGHVCRPTGQARQGQRRRCAIRLQSGAYRQKDV